MNKASIVLTTALLMTAALPLSAQNFDTSGTSGLSGKYLFRYVNFFNDQNGNLTESCTLSGEILFDGQGKYTTSNTTLADSLSPGGCGSLGGGTYGVQSNGMAQLDNPLYPATLFGTFSQPVVIASSTEDDYFDLFIAVQAPSASFSNASLNGAFTVGTLDFQNSSAALARQGYFTLHADGGGNIAAFTVNGSAANLSSGASIAQNVSASTYSLSGTAGGILTFPGSDGDSQSIVSGPKILYVSADGDWFVGGSASGSDMLFGFRAPSGTSSNALLSGTFFFAGMEDYLPGSFLDATWGAINSGSDGNLIWHERFDDVVDIETYDNTFNTPVTIGADGSFYDGSLYTYLAGANGSALMLIGSNQQFSLFVGVHAPAYKQTSTVWINPIGITNAANYTPITNAFAPGELVSLYGVFGVDTQVDQVLPIPDTLGGVQVFVNGKAAPVYLASQNQISALVPYEVASDFFATFQVVVNGSKSNEVTVYVDESAPGIYTLTQNGVGSGAILHSDYSVVTDQSPAKPGDTVLLFMNGLGTVTPSVADGVAGPSDPLSYSDEYNNGALFVFLDDGVDTPSQVDVPFAGLAPGFPGLYQVNFTIPTSGLTNGDVFIAFQTNEALNEMATISLSGFAQGAAVGARGTHARSLRRRSASSPKGVAGHAKKIRRALPVRGSALNTR